MFEMIGALLSAYVLYAISKGEVYAKSGPGGQTVLKRESPTYFWIIIAIYSGLSIALMIIF